MQRSARVMRSSTIGTSRSMAKLITVSRSTDSRTPHARGGVESTPSRTANTALRAPEHTSPTSFSRIGSSKPRSPASRRANAAFARDAASSACGGNALFEIARHEEMPAVAISGQAAQLESVDFLGASAQTSLPAEIDSASLESGMQNTATLAWPFEGSRPSIKAAPPKYATNRTRPSPHPSATLAFATLRAAFASLFEVYGSSICAIFAERSNCFTWSSTRNTKLPRSFLNKGASSSTAMPPINEAHEIAHVASAKDTSLPSSHIAFFST